MNNELLELSVEIKTVIRNFIAIERNKFENHGKYIPMKLVFTLFDKLLEFHLVFPKL